MPDVEVRKETRTITNVEGNLKVEEGRILTDAPDNILRVTGSVQCKGDCTFECGLSSDSFEARRGKVFVASLSVGRLVKVRRGELTVGGDVDARKIEVDRRLHIQGGLSCDLAAVGGSMRVEGTTTAQSVNVGGTLELGADSEIDRVNTGGKISYSGKLKSDRISAGGTVRGDLLSADRVDVGGKVEIHGQVELGEIDVGGKVVVGGGKITDEVDVGGTFESTALLIFKDMDVGGKVILAGGEGGDIDVGGVLRSNGDLSFGEMEVGGKVDIFGSSQGEELEVGGIVEVSGDLTLKEDLEVGGAARIGGIVKAASIRIGGELKAKLAEVMEDIEANTIRTVFGARADEIEISKNGEARGPLISREVIINNKSNVEDIYGEDVELGKGCRARNIYGKRIDIDSRSRISGEVLFTGQVEAEENVAFAQEPRKVQTLPDPPTESEGVNGDEPSKA